MINHFKHNENSPYLSVVAASRNDDHGGDPLIRTQIFINNFARQCEKYYLSAELIIVDWNPVAGRSGLAGVLDLPSNASYLKARVVTVPSALHERLKYSEALPLFQMIAKNVGIRRSRGKFILATNIDILFSNELIKFIAKQNLDPTKQYRVDRYDIQKGLSEDATLENAIDYAWSNPIRTNRRYQPEALVKHLYGDELFRKVCIPDPEFRKTIEGVDVVHEDDVWQLRPKRSVNINHLHTNACGDFTLLSREGWDAIRGYPEFASYSFNIDSMGVIASHYAGYEEVSLLPPCVCFHIEHGIGSGWTPEGEKKLFTRLRGAGILNPEWYVLTPLVDEMRESSKPLEFNHAKWGMADFDLPEQSLGDPSLIPPIKLIELALQAQTRDVSAIQPQYDLDRLTLMHERRLARDMNLHGFAAADRDEQVVIYIPDSDGLYSEANTIVHSALPLAISTVVFRIEKFAHRFPLRFDPCQRPGLLSISSIAVLDLLNNMVVLELDGRDLSKLSANGTAVWMKAASGWKKKFFRKNTPNKYQSLSLISTGIDPQLILPKLPVDIGFPLVLTVEMKFIPFK